MEPNTRERRMWLHVILAVGAIYSTLGLAGKMATELARRDLVDGLFAGAFVCAVVAIVGSGLQRGLARREVWLGLGIGAVYATVLLRLFVDPAERTHLFEYGIVALLIQRAWAERRRAGRAVGSPALIAAAATMVIGLGDELIQAVLPSRVFDVRDILFNAIAASMAVGAYALLQWARKSEQESTQPG